VVLFGAGAWLVGCLGNRPENIFGEGVEPATIPVGRVVDRGTIAISSSVKRGTVPYSELFLFRSPPPAILSGNGYYTGKLSRLIRARRKPPVLEVFESSTRFQNGEEDPWASSPLPQR
jgi:hypothetical protein